MLFAVVPLRNILPGTPPAGSWIDQAVVIWVLIALATALVFYIAALVPALELPCRPVVAYSNTCSMKLLVPR